MEIESVLHLIEKSELIKALYNVQLIGSINGVSGAVTVNCFDVKEC